MQPENRTQEMAETAERLQVIGSSILRAARKSDVFPAADAWRIV